MREGLDISKEGYTYHKWELSVEDDVLNLLLEDE